MKQTQWHSSKGNSCRQMTLTKQKLLLEILYTLYVATKTSRIPRKAKRIFLGRNFLFRISEYTQRERKCSSRKLQIFISQTTDFHFANYRFSFRKLQISISQTTDFHFANYRFSFRKLQIFISQTTDFHFANYRFSFRKLQISISQTTDSHFANYRFPFPFRFVPFRFANYSKPSFGTKLHQISHDRERGKKLRDQFF